MVQKDFPRYVDNEALACIMMNNVQQLRFFPWTLIFLLEKRNLPNRVELDKIYKTMEGPEQLNDDTNKVLNSLQKKLNVVVEVTYTRH
jgi:hypothetical protein